MKKIVRFVSIFIIIFSTVISCTVAACTFFLFKYKDSKVSEDLLKISRSSDRTVFYGYSDRSEHATEEPVMIENAALSGSLKYKYVSYVEIPDNLINAFVAIEDKRFQDHRGIDILRTVKATANFIVGGSKSFGGSTITQQLVKNLTGNDQISADRKIKEIFCALDLERNYDKTEILQMYLNVINLAHGCRGVGAAAQYYYSKEPSELTVSEAATIAAITNNPTKYDPERNPEKNKQRRDVILKCMLEEGYITEDEYKSAISTEICLSIDRNSESNGINSWFIDAVTNDVINDLCKKYEVSKDTASMMLYRGGYKIYTSMDISIQNILENYYLNELSFKADKDGNTPQSSMIIISPKGDILALVGAVGEKKGNRVQNYATDTKRPPGSIIKPLSVYAPAIDKGIVNWSTVIEDSPVKEGTAAAPPWPSNVNKKYVGNVNVKYAVENSLNTVAVKILDQVTPQASFDFLQKKLYIRSLDPKLDMGQASLALGQPSYGVTLRELVAAYTVFENGVMSKPRSYYKVTDSVGKIILDNSPEEEQVISKESAAIMTKLLETVVETGTARGLITLDRTVDVAGKTGTTQNNSDKYFVGYTPSLVAGVWFGFDYPKSLSEYGSNYSARIWNEVMSRIYQNTYYANDNNSFLVPDTVQMLTYDKETGNYPPQNDNDNDPVLENGWFEVK